jgi:hypothetical protein
MGNGKLRLVSLSLAFFFVLSRVVGSRHPGNAFIILLAYRAKLEEEAFQVCIWRAGASVQTLERTEGSVYIHGEGGGVERHLANFGMNELRVGRF